MGRRGSRISPVDFENVPQTEEHGHGDSTVNINIDDAKVILGMAAELEWDGTLDHDQKALVDRIIEAFPTVEVPTILQ